MLEFCVLLKGQLKKKKKKKKKKNKNKNKNDKITTTMGVGAQFWEKYSTHTTKVDNKTSALKKRASFCTPQKKIFFYNSTKLKPIQQYHFQRDSPFN